MNHPITPPQPQYKREHIFSIRLTSSEHHAIKQLAQQMNVSTSHLVRHFLMQIVEHYAQHHQGEHTLELEAIQQMHRLKQT